MSVVVVLGDGEGGVKGLDVPAPPGEQGDARFEVGDGANELEGGGDSGAERGFNRLAIAQA